jgi:hypothetical protein
MKPSQNLKLREYFLKKYNVILSEAEADLCLENLANLFLAFAKIEKRKIASAELLMKPDEAIFAGKISSPNNLKP